MTVETREAAAAREDAKALFLRQSGWAGARLTPLAGDASNRRYQRIAAGPGGAHAVLMDAPAARGEDIFRFLAFTSWLLDHGLSAPKVIAADVASGFALIEDLGDELYARMAREAPDCEGMIYGRAVDLLAHLAVIDAPKTVRWGKEAVAVDPYDNAALCREALLAMEWWFEGTTGAPPAADLMAEFADLVSAAAMPVAQCREVLVLRDYHAENLLWLPARKGLAQVGLLDYQDALTGSAAYDLVSLLEDARRDTSSALRDAMFDRYCAAAKIVDRDRLARDYAVLGAQRSLKIMGIFARLWLRDGKLGYLEMTPRVWEHLQRDLSHPSLVALRSFVERHLLPPTAAAIERLTGARQ
ncbi:MAG: phosphotransferase [Pseudomonadota bacterium]